MAKLYSPESEAQFEVIHLTRFFEQDGNVAAAWRCWHLARKFGLDLPDVILAEVDRFAAAISGVIDNVLAGDASAGLDSKTVAAAWGTARRGKEDPARALRAWDRDIGVAVDVFLKRKEMPATKAYQSVAKDRGMSVENVIRLFRKYRAEIGTGDAAVEV